MNLNKQRTALIEKYADLIVKTGVNLQKGQPVILRGPLEANGLIRLITRKCYQNGASYVLTEYIDSLVEKEKYMYGGEKAVSYFPKWKADGFEELCKNGACFIRITGDDPDVFADVPPEIIGLANKISSQGMKKVNKYTMNSELSWVVAGGATESWAKKIFPDMSSKDAVNSLWDKIFDDSRVSSENPLKAWEDHNADLKSKSDYLNKMQFASLTYTSAGNGITKGTNLKIELPENHIWSGGAEKNASGIFFNPNMPTEEVFTAPKKNGVSGYVSSTLPFNCNGNLVEDFVLYFKDGKVIDVTARKGLETLKTLISTDKGASYLGEVALVPYDSPISNTKTIFFNTLFDENASCHLAFGEAYPSCIQGGENMTEDELENHDINVSLIHNDFMIGSADLAIVATTKSGEQVDIFSKGNWAF
ncbi:MAG: aminopeptidase [Proteocatella sp.]